ncbi:MAG: C-type lectin domain-containing protein [Lachnospiraceae bacterium]|nr:C-type lectin domain-containing protein [Lachnospiraceae bacterium]
MASLLPWQACISRDGHLATVTSSEEQEYLKGLFYDVYGTSQGPWIGAYSNQFVTGATGIGTMYH